MHRREAPGPGLAKPGGRCPPAAKAAEPGNTALVIAIRRTLFAFRHKGRLLSTRVAHRADCASGLTPYRVLLLRWRTVAQLHDPVLRICDRKPQKGACRKKPPVAKPPWWTILLFQLTAKLKKMQYSLCQQLFLFRQLHALNRYMDSGTMRSSARAPEPGIRLRLSSSCRALSSALASKRKATSAVMALTQVQCDTTGS